MAEQIAGYREQYCRATYEDTGYRCEDTKGHSGPHFFTTTVEWEGCWSCRAKPHEFHEQGYCEAVLEALEAWNLHEVWP